MSEIKTAKLVIVKNPFQAWNGRIIKEIPAGRKIRAELIGASDIGCEIYTSVNGHVVNIDDYEVVGGEIITVSPVVAKGGGGKNIMMLVATVALSVVSMGVGNLAAGGAFFKLAAGEAWAAGSYLAAAATQMIGGMLINRAFNSMPKASSMNAGNEVTYGWSGVQTMEGQNNAIQMTYGKVKSGGQSIAKYVSLNGNKEYLNWLIACGEGELEFSDILINDNPYSYYKGVVLETRPGTNDQEVIPYFLDTYFSKSLGTALNDNLEHIDTAQGNATQGLIVRVEFSQGLYHYSSSKGKYKSAWVDLICAYRLKGTEEWTEFFNGRIKAKKTSALRKEFRVDDLEAGEYEVKVQVTGRSDSTTSTKASTKCWWNAITSIVYDDFIYPNIALIGVRALATDQLNGSPHISFIKERKWVWVYNSDTEEYEQKPANNPAWASYDMLHLASRLKNINTGEYEFEVRGVPAKSIIYEQFKEWADFCDAKQWPEGERDQHLLRVNIEVLQTDEMLNCINDNIATIGRGMVVRFGTKYGAIWYCKKQPVQMFGMGNIIEGTFNEEFLETTSRANVVEVTYMDADHDYNKETITIYGDNYDNDAVENATQVTFNGITSYNQAFREGKYQLACNKYQLRTVSFEANIDAIACTIGDVVLVAHDVPQWTHSGRIEEVDIERGIFKLPVKLTDTTRQLRLMYRTLNDKLYTINVSVLSNNDDGCTVSGTVPDISDPPRKNDLFDIGFANIGSKPFIITNITRALDFTRAISGVEYIEQLYDEQYDIPVINYSEDTTNVAQNVTGLNAKSIAYINGDGSQVTRLSVSWNAAENGGRYTVLISYDNQETWSILQSGISDCEYEGDIMEIDETDEDEGIYVQVVTTLGVSKSSGVIYGKIDRGIDELPPDVLSLDTEVLSDGTRRYYWDFEYPMPNDIAGFKMRYLQGTEANWAMGYDVQDGLIVTQPYETKTVRQGAHVVMIKAVDNAGNESEKYASCIVDFGDPLEENILYKHDLSTDNWSECETDGVIFDDGYVRSKQNSYHWSVANSRYWDNPDKAYWVESYESFYLQANIRALASGYFYLLYDIEGICNLTYKNNTTDDIFKPYSTKVFVKAGDIITIRFDSPAGNTRTILKQLLGVIDVPDRQEHFENITISTAGTELPITVPNYYTTAVSVDSIQNTVNGQIELEYISKNPCVIRFNKINNDAEFSRTPIEVVADITWQGYENEIV